MTRSAGDMRRVLREYPFVTEKWFIAAVRQFVQNLPQHHRQEFAERLRMLADLSSAR